MCAGGRRANLRGLLTSSANRTAIMATTRSIARAALVLIGAAALAACSGPTMLLNAIGAATDTSAGWAIVKHVHDKLVEGGPVPCFRLNTVERALAAHCAPYAPGSIRREDIAASKLPLCPLAVAAREPSTWPVLAELIDKGAMPESCARAPLVELAQEQPCPDFTAATPESLRSLRWLALSDARAVHHDAVRLLSCPRAVAVGLHQVVERWVADGAMVPGRLGFSPLGALHPDWLGSPLSAQLEAQGHHARGALDPFDGALRPGFEEAFRSAHLGALDWWLARVPELADRVPPPQGNQLPWVPLAQALNPQSFDEPGRQQEVVEFLLARGANPRRKLPGRPDMTVLRLAQQSGNPLLPLLERSPVAGAARSRVAQSGVAEAP